ncbi:hypothetical protein BpHYR1_009911 [Brachionus plicatilis]|uniref:Uncharacterized protein n=1 Tax=Brachionus plicatilis TaxID=10195 RepID=A0A3M7RFQ3_BRAPC|nr:hypothetical protein BpHYR1_009911 [Brachionus plicatilis]
MRNNLLHESHSPCILVSMACNICINSQLKIKIIITCPIIHKIILFFNIQGLVSNDHFFKYYQQFMQSMLEKSIQLKILFRDISTEISMNGFTIFFQGLFFGCLRNSNKSRITNR